MERPQQRGAGALARALARRIGGELTEAQETRARNTELSSTDGEIDTAMLDRSLAQALSRSTQIEEERTTAPACLAELLALSPLDRETAVIVEPRYQSYTLAAYTLERSWKAVFHDPGLARELARVARSIALQTDPRSCGGSAALADLEAYALAMEGNARRVAGELRESLVSFMQAREVQQKGGADPDLTGRIDVLEASLRRDLRQFGAAHSLLDRSTAIFRTLGDRKQAAYAVINRANVYLVQRDLNRAISTLKEALTLVQDPWLSLCVRHNLIMTLAECGEAHEAADLYEQSRSLYLQFSDPLTTSRRLWTEGLIARELGNLDTARALLSETVERLAEQGYGFDAALAGLDLVAVYAKQGKSDEILGVASDLIQLFQMRNVQPEALAALRIIQQAAESKVLDLTILAQAADLVRDNQVVRGASTD
jgi:tetratricopeptide (TPR) repeat protein